MKVEVSAIEIPSPNCSHCITSLNWKPIEIIASSWVTPLPENTPSACPSMTTCAGHSYSKGGWIMNRFQRTPSPLSRGFKGRIRMSLYPAYKVAWLTIGNGSRGPAHALVTGKSLCFGLDRYKSVMFYLFEYSRGFPNRTRGHIFKIWNAYLEPISHTSRHRSVGTTAARKAA